MTNNRHHGDMEQTMSALGKANRVRLERARIKRAILAGHAEAADVIREVPYGTQTMTLRELLTAQRRWGNTRARKFCLSLSLNEHKLLETLTDRQKDLLIDGLQKQNGKVAL